MKKDNSKNLLTDIPTDQLPNFNTIEASVFSVTKAGDIYIGREKIKPELKEALREQSRYLLSSQLYEILRATIINESAQLALIQSTEWNHVVSAKMLRHWHFVLENMLKQLTNIK